MEIDLAYTLNNIFMWICAYVAVCFLLTRGKAEGADGYSFQIAVLAFGAASLVIPFWMYQSGYEVSTLGLIRNGGLTYMALKYYSFRFGYRKQISYLVNWADDRRHGISSVLRHAGMFDRRKESVNVKHDQRH